MNPTQPTQKDVARLAGVSQAVVSAVINGHTKRIGASDDVKALVLQAARKLGYRIHTGAKSMRCRKLGTIGHFCPGRFDWDFDFPGTRPGLFKAAAALGFRIVYARLGACNEIPDVLKEFSLDGLIIHHGGILDPNLKTHLSRHGVPTIFLNDKHSHNSVHLDDVGAAREITQHLVDRGYRRILYFSTTSFIKNHHSWMDRVQGYTCIMRESELETRTLILDAGDRNNSRRDLHGLLDSSGAPDAILCHSDHDATILFSYLYDSRWLVPRDFAVAGFEGDIVCGNYLPIPLTTMRVDRFLMAHTAVEMLVRLLRSGPETKLPSVVIRPPLSVGNTTPHKFVRTQKPADLKT